MKKRRKYSIILVLTVLLVFSTLLPASADVNSDNSFSQAISAIENWLESVPDKQYKVTASDEVFKWKVELEKCGFDNYKKFVLYSKMLKEIGNKQFKYQNYIFNKKTLIYFQLDKYSNYYTDYWDQNEGSEGPVSPDQFLKEKYEFYINNVESKKEQWDWINQFMTLVSYSSYGAEEQYITSLRRESYKTVLEVLKQYIVLSKYFLKNHSNVIINTGNYYSDMQTLASTISKVDSILSKLYTFSDTWGKFMSQEEKDIILNFALPEFKNNDYSVKIYLVLSE